MRSGERRGQSLTEQSRSIVPPSFESAEGILDADEPLDPRWRWRTLGEHRNRDRILVDIKAEANDGRRPAQSPRLGCSTELEAL